MSTKHLLLALLEIEPSSGYDLAFRSVASLGPVWTATHSQIYTALKNMLAEGLLSAEDDPTAGERRRTVYSLTDAGRAELARWQMAQIEYIPGRDPFLLWVQASLASVPQDVALAHIERHVQRVRQRRETCRAIAASVRNRENETVERRASWMPESELRRVRAAKAVVYEMLTDQADAELRSLKLLKRTLRDMDANLDSVGESSAP